MLKDAVQDTHPQKPPQHRMQPAFVVAQIRIPCPLPVTVLEALRELLDKPAQHANPFHTDNRAAQRPPVGVGLPAFPQPAQLGKGCPDRPGEPSARGQREPVTVTTDLVREVPSALIANGTVTYAYGGSSP
jgi:hypothetical protein